MRASVFEEIRTLRGKQALTIDPRNQNRYRILIKEPYGTTAYCFSTPIYELESRKLVSLQFVPGEAGFVFQGSNGRMTAKANHMEMKNDNGTVTVMFPRGKFTLQDTWLSCGKAEVHPTLNGFAVTVRSAKKPTIKLKLKANDPLLQVRANEKYFALMQEAFRPFMSVSALYAKDADGTGCYPVHVSYEQPDEQSYIVELAATNGQEMRFEVNLYEPKLFQDTTVESRHPEENNAFGSVAFLGHTEVFGEQWLYSRPDFSKIPEIYRLPIKKVLLHLPKYNAGNTALSVFAPQARFCSFGSNWNNKIAHSEALTESGGDSTYQTIDITDLVVNKPEQTIKNTEGIILKSNEKGNGFSAVATGDNYDTPQILEIQYF